MKLHKIKTQKKINRVLFVVITLIFLLFVLFPYYWMLVTALKPKGDLFVTPPDFFPKKLIFRNIWTPWGLFPVATYLKNSLLIAFFTVFLNVGIGSMAAYGLNQPQFKQTGNLIVTFLLLTQLLPGIVTLVPFYFWMTKMKLLNTYIGLILPYLAWTLPFTILMLKAYFSNAYPRELEEAATIDGCTRLQIYIKVVMPLAVPGMVAAGANAFMLSWKEFVWASIMLTSGSKKPIAIGLFDMMSEGGGVGYIQEFMAVAIAATIPAFFLFFFTQKYIAGGITAGAVKS